MNKNMSIDEFNKIKEMFTKKLIKSEKNRLNSMDNGSKIKTISIEGLESENEYVPNITEQMKREQDEREVRDYYNSVVSFSNNNKEIEKMYNDKLKGGKKTKHRKSKNKKSKNMKTKKHKNK